MQSDDRFTKIAYLSVAYLSIILAYVLGWIYSLNWLRWACYLVFFLLLFATLFGAFAGERAEKNEGIFLYNVLPPYAQGREDYFPLFENLNHLDEFWKEDFSFSWNDSMIIDLDNNLGGASLKRRIDEALLKHLSFDAYEIKDDEPIERGHVLAYKEIKEISLAYLKWKNIRMSPDQENVYLEVVLPLLGFGNILKMIGKQVDRISDEKISEILLERSSYISREYYHMVANLDYGLALFDEMQKRKNGHFHRGQSVHLEGEVYPYEFFLEMWREVDNALHHPNGVNLKGLNARLSHLIGVMLRQGEYRDKNARS